MNCDHFNCSQGNCPESTRATRAVLSAWAGPLLTIAVLVLFGVVTQ